MSSLIRGEVFDWLIGSVELSNSVMLNWSVASLLGFILYVITFKMVGRLYDIDAISGSLAGKICYFILFIINIFISAIILRIIKGIIWLYNYLTTVSIVGWLSILGVSVLMITGILYIRKRRNIKGGTSNTSI